MLLMAFLDAKDGNKKDMWFIDSRCSNHMCEKKEYFIDFDENFVDTVKLQNNTSLAMTGKGNVKLQEKGLAILFQHDRCKVYHSEKGLIMDTKMVANRMFKLHVVIAPLVCFSTITEAKVWLCHCKYGHLSYNGLKTL
ncbi:hypothetical protein HRI_000472200 [Hibiscus trionum]|uniref:Retrovirus-related Pol polyprotein from transposon TNT 1-94-like beta-barrel domain-containing protein n=1 Tax=Hibiscus trionum TaxID=183268 RepID=A0A9W7LKU8_HIBTR|nr:hypothetical protein HRI_000472200 [Hibiscus trionum]